MQFIFCCCLLFYFFFFLTFFCFMFFYLFTSCFVVVYFLCRRALLLIISVCCFPDLIAYSLVTVKLLISGDISNYLLCHSVTLIRTNFSICCSHYSFFSTFISPNCLKKVTSMHGSLLCTIRREKNMPNQRT